MQEMKPIKEGKVREIYDNGDNLIMVATDRISCFDVILNNVVTKKGTVLTQMSKFWFEMTEDILPNHMISTDVKDMPEYFQQDQFDGNSMMCRKLDMLPLECIVRGYITGSGWESYKKNHTTQTEKYLWYHFISGNRRHLSGCRCARAQRCEHHQKALCCHG